MKAHTAKSVSMIRAEIQQRSKITLITRERTEKRRMADYFTSLFDRYQPTLYNCYPKFDFASSYSFISFL